MIKLPLMLPCNCSGKSGTRCSQGRASDPGDTDPWRVRCLECIQCGPYELTPTRAINAWNNQVQEKAKELKT